MPLIPDLPAEKVPVSALPKFIVLRLDEGDALVECPRTMKRCGNQFIVHLQTWIKMSGHIGRNCPYCYKVSQIPPEEIINSGTGERL